jgi:protein TonB
MDSKSHCEKIEPPVEITKKKPNYPDEIRRQEITGSVVIQGTLSGDQAPAAFRVISSADRRLTDLALEAFREWRYKPAVCDGIPLDTYVTVTFSFKLK